MYEIPVAAEGADVDRIYLVGVGDSSLSALRAAGAALGKKVRGKAIEIVSLCANTPDEIKAHGASLALGAYQWNLKTDKTTEVPQLVLATTESGAVTTTSAIAEALYTARDLILTPSNIKNPLWLA